MGLVLSVTMAMVIALAIVEPAATATAAIRNTNGGELIFSIRSPLPLTSYCMGVDS